VIADPSWAISPFYLQWTESYFHFIKRFAINIPYSCRSMFSSFYVGFNIFVDSFYLAEKNNFFLFNDL
jgi:hypothetical protein